MPWTAKEIKQLALGLNNGREYGCVKELWRRLRELDPDIHYQTVWDWCNGRVRGKRSGLPGKYYSLLLDTFK